LFVLLGTLKPREQRGKPCCIEAVGRHYDEIETAAVLDEIIEKQDAVALLGAALADGEEAREPPPGGAVLRISENVGRTVGKDEPRSDRDLDRPLLLALIRAVVPDVLVGPQVRRGRSGTHLSGYSESWVPALAPSALGRDDSVMISPTVFV
jgi:hypothetical protein